MHDYLEAAELHLTSKLLLRALEREIGALKLSLANRSGDNFTEVGVEVELPYAGIVAAFQDFDLLGEAIDEFPARPAIWGRQPRPSGWPHGFTIQRVEPYVSPPGWVNNDSSARIFFQPKDVRPFYEYTFDRVCFIADASHAGSTVTANWLATATNVSGRAEGHISFNVGTDPLQPEDLLPHA